MPITSISKRIFFFEDHRDYSYYQMSYRPDSYSEKSFDDELLINGRFYGRFQDRALSYMDVSRHLESAYPAVLSNQAAMEEVKRQWPSIAEAIKGSRGGEGIYNGAVMYFCRFTRI